MNQLNFQTQFADMKPVSALGLRRYSKQRRVYGQNSNGVVCISIFLGSGRWGRNRCGKSATFPKCDE
jgi:hypothetical protein